MSPRRVARGTHRSRGAGIAASRCWVTWSCSRANVQAPVIGITGTNGKSTVTSLVARMAAAAGRTRARRRQFGRTRPRFARTAHSGSLCAGAVEFSTGDHVLVAAPGSGGAERDGRFIWIVIRRWRPTRWPSRGFSPRRRPWCLNADDPRVGGYARGGQSRGGRPRGPHAHRDVFPSKRTDADFSLLRTSVADLLLARHGEGLLDVSRMKITGLHNAANALAGIGLGRCGGIAHAQDARRAPGLSRPVATARSGSPMWPGCATSMTPRARTWGATIAAVAGMPGPLVMIAGGEGKGQDFTPLADAFRGKVRHVVVDRQGCARGGSGPCGRVSDGNGCVDARGRHRGESRCPGGRYRCLLSPACASLDMFRDYGHRGDVVRRRRPTSSSAGPA